MDDTSIFPSFVVDIKGITKIISDNRYKKVVLQGPEGMKRGLFELSNIIEERTGAVVWVDGELCYGACDHGGERANLLGVDALIHLGHSDIPSMGRDGAVPLHFFHAEMKNESRTMQGSMGKIINTIEKGKISLFTTVQHLGLLDEARSFLESRGYGVHVGDPGGREEFPGQVIGCSFSPAKDLPDDVSTLLFLGTGRFHPLGLCLSSGKEVHTLDPMTGETGVITKDDLDSVLRSRFANITRAKDMMKSGDTIGVIIGFKPGQRRVLLAEEMVSILNINGMKGRIIISDHLDPMKLRSLGLKVAVSTSCPRIAIDDSTRYLREDVTIITPVELRIALDILSWSDYSFDDEW